MDNLTGQMVGQYQLLELIHQGENTVYKGFWPGTNGYVAVKILSPARSSDPDKIGMGNVADPVEITITGAN